MNPMTDRAAWLAWRRGGIGGSDAAAIVGVDPWRGAMSIWLDKTGRLPLEDEPAEYTRWGNLLEPAIADEFQVRTGLAVPTSARALMLEHRTFNWMRATIDGLVTEAGSDSDGQGETPLGLVEIKTVAGFKRRDWDDEVPEHYQLQVQHQLAVTGLERAWLAVLFGGQHLELVELQRDDSLIESLVDLERTFWERHVLADVAPAEPGPGASEDLRRAFPGFAGAEVELPAEVENLFRLRRAAAANVRFAEAEQAGVDAALMAMLGDAEVGLVNGRPRVTWKRQRRAEHVVPAAEFRVLRLVTARGENDEV